MPFDSSEFIGLNGLEMKTRLQATYPFPVLVPRLHIRLVETTRLVACASSIQQELSFHRAWNQKMFCYYIFNSDH